MTIKGKKREKTFNAGDQFGPELIYFSDCILNDEEPEPSGEEGLNDVRIICAIHESADRHTPVRLNEMAHTEMPDAEQKIKAPKVKEPERLVNARTPAESTGAKDQ